MSVVTYLIMHAQYIAPVNWNMNFHVQFLTKANLSLLPNLLAPDTDKRFADV